jgi:hypothetical protein
MQVGLFLAALKDAVTKLGKGSTEMHLNINEEELNI